MGSVFAYSFSAVMPIILLILIGVLARRTGYLDIDTLRKLNRFNFRYALFALMFVNIYEIESIHNIPVKTAAFVIAVLLILFLFGVFYSRFATNERFRRGVLIQSAFRSNYAVIGLPVAETLVGAPGLQLASFLQLPVVTFFNFMCVLTLSIFSDPEAEYRYYGEGPLADASYSEGRGGVIADPSHDEGGAGNMTDISPAAPAGEHNTGMKRSRLAKILRGIITNPLIQGLMLGLIVLIIRNILPLREDGQIVFSLQRDLSWLYSAVKSLSRTATPIALIVLGGQLELKEIEGYRRELISGILVRLIAAPIISFSLVFLAVHLGWLTVTPVEIAVFVAIFGSPQAVSSIVMSTEMGGDGHLAGQIVIWSSIFGMFTLFAIIFILRLWGML